METEQDRITMLGNPAKPQGEEGEQMLLRMNESHGAVTQWALGLMDVKENDRILDIGCGGGAALAQLSKRICTGSLTGVDYSPVSVKTAAELNKADVQSGKMKIVEGSVENLPFADGQFDQIITVESFYFWPNPAENLKEVFRVLKDGGKFFLILDIYRKKEMRQETMDNIERYHLYVPTIGELQEMFEKAGLADIQIHTVPDEDWITAEGTRIAK